MERLGEHAFVEVSFMLKHIPFTLEILHFSYCGSIGLLLCLNGAIFLS